MKEHAVKYFKNCSKVQKNILLTTGFFCLLPLILFTIPIILSLIFFFVPVIVSWYLFLYALIHVFVVVYPPIASYAIFMNLVYWPFPKLAQPHHYGLSKVHNFYIETDPEKNVKCGVWHFIPEPLIYNHEEDASRTVKDHFDTYFKMYDSRPIIMYVHGQDSNRARVNRRNLCLKLSKLGYHVFAIDYRGYGDSSGWPSEKGVVKDVVELFNFIQSKCHKKTQLYIWGHSLGTGISTHAAKVLSESYYPPAGLILEAPFVNISKASKDYILAPLVLNNQWIKDKLDIALNQLDIKLSTDKNILKVNSKILIIHAADDWFIPQEHSFHLMKICQEKRPVEYPAVKLIEYSKDLSLGHNEIYLHDKLYPEIKEFIGTD